MTTNSQERVQPNWRQKRGAWFSQEEYAHSAALKQAALEALLGPSAGELPMRSAVEGGGLLDMYPLGALTPGTALATRSLIYPDGQGPRPNRYGTYELVAFTRQSPAVIQTAPLFAGESEHARSDYECMIERVQWLLSAVARESALEAFEPGDCRVVWSGEHGPFNVLFDRYLPDQPLRLGRKKYHLLLCMEILPVEYEYARHISASRLIDWLQEAGHYPYSDLDREAVV